MPDKTRARISGGTGFIGSHRVDRARSPADRALAVHKFARPMLADKPIPVHGDGSAERDFSYVDDIGAGVDRFGAWRGQARLAVAAA